MITEYIVMSAAAKMPSTCWGTYRRVAVLEVDIGAKPKMISERARGVVRIVRTWEKLNGGTTERCAYEQALAAARELARELNTPVLTIPMVVRHRNGTTTHIDAQGNVS